MVQHLVPIQKIVGSSPTTRFISAVHKSCQPSWWSVMNSASSHDGKPNMDRRWTLKFRKCGLCVWDAPWVWRGTWSVNWELGLSVFAKHCTSKGEAGSIPAHSVSEAQQGTTPEMRWDELLSLPGFETSKFLTIIFTLLMLS